ncbi:MAG: hypothetical protein U0O20_04410, partial [Collinsella aerofaciens]
NVNYSLRFWESILVDSKAQVDAQNKRAPRDAMPYNVCCWSLVAADNQLMEAEGEVPSRT